MTLSKKEQMQVGTEGIFSSTLGHLRVPWAEESAQQKTKLQLALDTFIYTLYLHKRHTTLVRLTLFLPLRGVAGWLELA